MILVAALLAAAVLDGAAAEDAFSVSFDFKDGGVWRRATRGPVPGSNERPVDVVYQDPATGRSTRAQIGRGVIVQGDPAGLDDVVVVKAVMRARELWLVESTRPGEDGLALAARLSRGDVVKEAFPNLRLRHTLHAAGLPIPPDDPRYPSQFYLFDLDIEDAWALAQGTEDTVVAVVDNGCDLGHPDLVAKLEPGHDVVDDDDDPSFTPSEQSNEHGTACAGLIAAETHNGIDIAGACPLCRLSCTRLLPGESENVPLDADVAAFDFALQDNVAVVSNSWGFVDAIPVPEVLAEAIRAVATDGRSGKGAIVVFAAGNESREVGDDELLAVEGVIGVGAVNNLGELTQFSNTGASVDVVAPTGAVTTDISGNDGEADGDVTFRFGGTSSACPLVAGIAALLVSFDPELTRKEVEEILNETAEQSLLAEDVEDNGHDDEYGFGLVQPRAALDRVVDPPPEIEGSSGCPGCGGGEGEAAVAFPLLLLLRLRLRLMRRRAARTRA